MTGGRFIPAGSASRLLLFALLLLTSSARTQTILDSLTAVPPTVDVSGGAQSVTVTMYLRHSAGPFFVMAYLGHPDSSALVGFGTLTSGTVSNGVWEAEVSVSQSTAPGVYPVYVSELDSSFSLVTINSGKSVTVVGGDTEPPVLASLPVVTPSTIDVSGGPDTVVVEFDLTDNASGVSFVFFSFERDDTVTGGGGFASLVSGDNMNGTWGADVVIPQNADGQFDLRITAIDNASNTLDTILGPVLTVSGGDTILPSVSGTPIVDHPSVNVGTGDQNVKVTLTALDTYSGISTVEAYFMDDSGNSSGSSFSTTLVSGDSLNGTWELNITFYETSSEGSYHLLVFLSDVAGNNANLTFPGVTVQVTRAPEADVTFQLDSRRLERTGLFRREVDSSPVFHIFAGPDSGVISLNDGDGDSVWTATVLIQAGQVIHYAYALPVTGGDVFELGGEAGGRNQAVDSTGVLVLPVVNYDDLSPTDVAPGYSALVRRDFSPGGPTPTAFDDDSVHTFVAADFNSLGGDVIVAVRRYAAPGGGSAPSGIVVMAQGLYWGIATAPAALTFNATVSFGYTFFGGVADPSALRLLRRGDSGQPWEIVTTILNTDQGTLEAAGVSAFSDWTIGSTSAANTLVPTAPGIVSVPVPPDSSAGVGKYPALSWAAAAGAYWYDLYVWPAADTMPATPTAADIPANSYNLYSGLAYNTAYHWRVVAKNIAGSTPGTVWTFNTTIVPDLAVTDIQVPGESFSGQGAEIGWTVTNGGATGTTSPSWIERIYLSADSILTPITDPLLGAVQNLSSLGAGGGYSNQRTFVIPNGLFGVYRIIAVTDPMGQQVESDDSNNTFIRDIPITLTPPPDLRVDVFSVPALGFSGQPVPVQYTVKNYGTNITTSPSWYDAIYYSSDSVFVPAAARWLKTINRTAYLLPESSYTVSDNVVLPDTVSGQLYLFVVTDVLNHVFEYAAEDNNTRRADIMVSVSPPPDLVVAGVSAPAAGNSGTGIALQWTVSNPGSADALRAWSDRVMIGTSPLYNPDSVTVIGSFTNVRGLERDSSYTRQATVTLPNGISGPYYVHVETDWKKQVFEYTSESNNVGSALAATNISLSPWADLEVTSVVAPATATANDVVSVEWTVANDGTSGVAGSWVDSVYISTAASWDTATARRLVAVIQNRSLANPESYTVQTSLRIPADVAGGSYYFYVFTDRGNSVYEHTDEDNNAGRSDAIGLSAYPAVDLSVASLNAGAGGSSGAPFPLEYIVTNIGAGTTLTGSWIDVLYLSADSVLNYSGDIRLERIDRLSTLAAGESYTRTIAPVLPEGISGDFYVIVRTDSASAVSDIDPSNNVRRTALPVTIALTPSPDLVASDLVAPPGGQAGQPVTVVWTVANSGAGIPAGRSWIDGLFLSSDATADIRDARLGSLDRAGPLPNGGSYQDTLVVILPNYASGTYYIVASADNRNEVYEYNAEANNSATTLIAVTIAPPADLVVNAVAVPASAIAGEDVTVDWTINNQGLNPAAGLMTDAVYFSTDSTWDIADLLLGTSMRQIDIAPGASSRASLTANLASAAMADSSGNITDGTPGLFPGDYYVIVRTDVRDNIRETDNANNTGVSSSPVPVDVQSLALGVEDTGSISSASPRYYKVNVPDNLDLRVTAASSVPYPSIDLFAALGRVPTGNDYDARTTDPISLAREVLVPSTQAGSYYLLMRSLINPSQAVTETYSVIAETLGFSVVSITPERGGSGGFVTAELAGAGFRPTSRIFLFSGTQQIAEAKLRSFQSTMGMTVRWDLRGVPLGIYDVEVRNQDSSTARLAGGFTVEPMRDLSISVSHTTPRLLLVGRKETYHFSFTNTSNIDIAYFFTNIAVPGGTEISVTTDSDLLRTRNDLVPDSLIPEGETLDDWTESEDVRIVPLIGQDIPPGEAYNCRITFQNPGFAAGSDFPMAVLTRTMTEEGFLAAQLPQIETYRAELLRNPANGDPESVALMNDPVAFAQFALGGYVPLGLLDSTDIGSLGFDMIAAAMTRQQVPQIQGVAGVNKAMLAISMSGDTPCDAFFSKLHCVAGIIDCFIHIPLMPFGLHIGLCAAGLSTCTPLPGLFQFMTGVDPHKALCFTGGVAILTCVAQELICKRLALSFDPNDIIGPEGFGDERWVARRQILPYTIRFQNDSVKAMVPARRVTITQQLDTTADIRSLRLGSFGFNNMVFPVPDNISTYNDRLDLRDSMGIFVDVTGGIDIVNGRIFWTFNTVDPLTGGAPDDPFAGFLPVDDSTGRGNGFVNYTIRPNPTAKTRDTIHAQAEIVFDINDPLDTPPIFNIVDAAAPASSVRPLPPTIDITSFPVHWGGVEDSAGSGLKHYTIYSSRNGEPYTAWLTNVTDTIAVFTGSDSSQYNFYSVGSDIAGNTEAFKSVADATTSILTGVDDAIEELPKTFALAQNYPNPFNPTTMVRYDVPAAAWVRLTVYNVLGQEVTVLFNGPDSPGRKVVEWNAVNRHGFSLPSGVYFYRMEATNMSDPSVKFRDVKKMMLIR